MAAPYSPFVKKGNLIFVAGHIHLGEDGNLVGDTVEEKAHQVLKNLQNTLAAAGADFSHVAKVSIFLTNMDDYAAVNEVYATYFKPPYPAREAVQVTKLPLGASIEISLIASL